MATIKGASAAGQVGEVVPLPELRVFIATQQIPKQVIPDGYHAAIGHLMKWGRSGLIAGLNQVKSYHPPIKDPVTGILVNFPATVHSQGNIASYRGNTTSVVADLPNAGFAGKSATVGNFDAKVKRMGTSVYNAQSAVEDIGHIKSLADQFDEQTYQSVVSGTYKETFADRVAAKAGSDIPRITDNYDDAIQYLSARPLHEEMSAAEKAQFAANQDQTMRQEEENSRSLVVTGLPCAIPGVLNVVAVNNSPTTTYTPPTFTKTTVK